MKSTIGIAFISLLLAILFCEYDGKRWEEKLRNYSYAIQGDSIPEFIKEYTDSSGVPYVYYAEENGIKPGYQRNATIVANYALQYFDSARNNSASDAQPKFLCCAQWLLHNITYRNGYALYAFNWRQPWYPNVDSGFTSGMSSGLALEVFAKAHQLTDDMRYWFAGKQLLQGFYLPIQQGGFTIADSAGWWYEEFADSTGSTPRVFDGHLFAVLGLHAWLQHDPGNDSAAFLVARGVKAAEANLIHYNAGGSSVFYDGYKKVANNRYEQVLADQLNRMYAISGIDDFMEMSQRLTNKRKRLFVIASIADRNLSGILLFCMLSGSFFVFLSLLRRLFRHPSK